MTLLLIGVLPSASRGGGLEDWACDLPVAVLSPRCKAAIVYLLSILCGQHRLVLPAIRRSHVLEDAILRLRASLGGAASPPYSLKVFPSFKADTTREVEAGEGHGPRKEFFDVCAAGLSD